MSYLRVIPRDLFNEASFLKCLGQFYLLTEHDDRVSMEYSDFADDFEIDQNDNGALFSTAIQVYVMGNSVDLTRPLNSRRPYPLYLWDDILETEVDVFDDSGQFSEEMKTYLTLAASRGKVGV